MLLANALVSCLVIEKGSAELAQLLQLKNQTPLSVDADKMISAGQPGCASVTCIYSLTCHC